MPLDDAGQWHPPLFPKQKEALAACLPSRKNRILLSGPRWASKCVSPDTLIYTDEGLRPIGEFGTAKEGCFSPIQQTVASMAGSAISSATATHFYNSGFKECLKLKTSLGYELTCSTNHPIWSEHDGEIRYRTAEEIEFWLSRGDRIWLPMVRRHSGGWATQNQRIRFAWFPEQDAQKYAASQRIMAAVKAGVVGVQATMRASGSANPTVHKYLTAPMDPKSLTVEIDEDMAYVMGILVGDGCYTAPVLKAYRVGLSTNDFEIAAAVRAKLKTAFPDATLQHGDGCDYHIRSCSFRAFLKEVGMWQKYAHEKEFPPAILASPKPVIVAFLQGLFDTDGTTSKGQAVFCSSSENLARTMQQVLLALGVRSSRNFRANNHRGAWIVATRNEDGFRDKVGFRLLRKQAGLYPKVSYTSAKSAYPDSLVPVLKRLNSTRADRGVGPLARKVHNRVIGSVLRRNTALSVARLKPFVETLACGSDPEIQQFLMGWEVWWDEVKETHQTTSQLVDIAVPATKNFIGNGFINHNTVVALHAVAQHAWITNHANICLLAITQSVGIDSGIWTDLTEKIIPLWINGKFGMRWAKEPYIRNVTKKPACEVWNRHGTRSRITLESLKDESEVENRFKSRNFTMIFLNELSKFKESKTYDTLIQCLRFADLTDEEDFADPIADEEWLFLADTNPADEGDQSWIYKEWFDLRSMTNEQVAEAFPEVEPDTMLPRRDSLNLIEFSIDDNLSLSTEKKRAIKADFAHDADLLARYYYGKWVVASADALFRKVFRPSAHVVPPIAEGKTDDPTVICPADGCIELITGHDPGAVNYATVILEPWLDRRIFRRTDLKTGRDIVEWREVRCFNAIDELVVVDEDFALSDYVEELTRKMEFWEDVLGLKDKLMWRNWSDRFAFDTKIPFSERYWHQAIYTASGGKISLMAAERGKGTVAARIDLFRKLLFHRRIVISGNRCPQLVAMCKSIKKGPTTTTPIAKGSPFKHVFDAVTYALASELYDEMEGEVDAVNKRNREGTSTVVQV